MILYKGVILLLFTLILAEVICYPTGKTGLGQDANKMEKQYPNGTVVGKYSCTDKEGNPVQVKYYADDGGYGVELKSIKVVGTSNYPNEDTSAEDFFRKNLDSNIPIDVPIKSKQSNKLKSDPFEFLHKNLNKLDIPKVDKSRSYFETYYQNVLSVPKECGKEKVRVYFDRERKNRNVLRHSDGDKYCEQY